MTTVCMAYTQLGSISKAPINSAGDLFAVVHHSYVLTALLCSDVDASSPPTAHPRVLSMGCPSPLSSYEAFQSSHFIREV